MTGPEHYRQAEEYLEAARGSFNAEYDGYVARAQVHATLALAAGTAARTDEHLIVLPRPKDSRCRGLDFEGGSYEDDNSTGWQVVPYSTDKNWVCSVEEADSVLFRGADGLIGGHISFYEARRFAAALAALADRAEQGTEGGS
jgi:hypothetical protein